jgi:tetratricopeptide (TPR) repeat protein
MNIMSRPASQAHTISQKTIQLMGKTLSLWKGLFVVLVFIQLVLVIFTSRDYGITIDEPPHAYYGKHIVHWYLSGFEEDDFLNAGNMLFYGGLFDTLVHPLTVISPFDIHDTRHLCNALVGLLGIVATYKLGAYLGSPLTGLLAALFLIFTPRFYGHSFNNPKDIPFAVCYIWGLYYLIQSVAELPDLSGKTLLKTAVAIGLTMAVRVGGFILLFYMGLVFFVRYVQLGWQTKPIRHQVLVWGKQYVFQVLSIALIAYVLMLLFWPRALIDPFVYPFHVLRVFSNFTYYVTTFFEGAEITWIEIPWYYVPKWLSMIVPEFVFVGLLLGVVWCVMRRERMGFNGVSLKWYLLVFASLFPPMYAVAIGSPLGDGLRHFLFIYPSVAILSSSGVTAFVRYVESIWIRRCVVGVMGMLMLMVVWDMVRLHPNQYIYFNRLVAGGLAEASKGYQTDYWENSYKQGVKWLDIHYQPKLGRRLRVGGASDNVQYLLDASRYEFVPVPEPELMDVYMSTTRADGHRMVPGEIIKTIDQDGVPLLYMIRPDSTYNGDLFFASVFDRNFRLGWYANKANDLQMAIRAYRRIVAAGEADAVVYNNLAGSLVMSQEFEEAAKIYKKAVAVQPNYLKAKINYASVLMELRQFEASREILEAVVLQHPTHFQALRNLGLALYEGGHSQDAVSIFEQAIQIQPQVSDVYSHLGLAFLAQRDTTAALQAFEKVEMGQENWYFAHIHLASLLQERGDFEAAEKTYRHLIQFSAGQIDAYEKLGSLLLVQKRLIDATCLLERATYVDGKRAGVWYLMGQVHLLQGQIPLATTTLLKAVELAPEDPLYREALFRVGGMCHENGLPGLAREVYDRILTVEPDYVLASINLGILNFSEKRYEEAVENFSRAVVLQPQDVEALLGLAQTYEKTGHVTDAQQTYQKILVLDADNTIALELLQALDIKN